MENASKALLMTGSILIGIILLSLGVYIFNIMSEARRIEASTLTEEQLVKYNLEYTSFNKSRMYGTDVITVLNKAIDNNKKYAKDDKSMFIDIAFTLTDNVSVVVKKYEWTGKKFEVKNLPTRSIAKGNDKYQYEFIKGKTYSLENEEHAKMIENFLKTSTDATEEKDESGIRDKDNLKNGDFYTVTYSGFSDFKRMIFKCSKIEYNEVGKVCYMEFTQVVSSTY